MHTPNKSMARIYNLFLFVCILQNSAEMKHPQNTEEPLSDKLMAPINSAPTVYKNWLTNFLKPAPVLADYKTFGCQLFLN